MIKKVSYSVFLLSLLVFISATASSQENTMISPYIQLKYTKNTDNQRILQTSLTYSKNRMEIPLPGMEISFFTGGDSKDLIANVITDDKGIATLELSSELQLPVNIDGMWELISEYNGNDTIEAGTSELTIKDVKLEMDLTEADSIKTISLTAFIMEDGTDKPVSGEALKVYVPRMFSLLPIGEVFLDDSGTAIIEFPSDLPGDSLGYLTVIAKFEDNGIFGNVEKQIRIKWGVPTVFSEPKFHRALWTKTAPKWMIYSLSVLLAGVWGHYFYAIISLIRIKMGSKGKSKKEIRR